MCAFEGEKLVVKGVGQEPAAGIKKNGAHPQVAE